jgi:hypothetical protein
LETKGVTTCAVTPSVYLVAGAHFELWKRPLTFELLLSY